MRSAKASISGTARQLRRALLARDVDHAEAVPLGVGEDHVVGVRRSLVPVDLGRSEREQTLDLLTLVLGVQIEVETRRYLQRRADPVERDIRPHSVRRTEQDEVVALPVVSADIAERRLPEPSLTLEIVDAQNDRADAEH